MGNPARELLELMDSWESDGTLVMRRTAGAVNSGESVEFWEAQKRAVGLLMRVEEFLKDDGSYEDDAETLVEVWQELFPPRNDWCVEPVSRYMSRGTRSMLRQIGRRMERESAPLTDLTPEVVKGLREALEELRVQLGVVPELPAEERERLLQLVGHALRLLDDPGAPAEEVRSVSCEVAGAVIPVARFLPEDARQGFLKRLGALVLPWVSDVTSGAVGGLLVAGGEALVRHISG